MSGKGWFTIAVGIISTGLLLFGNAVYAATSITVRADTLLMIQPGSTFDYNIYVDVITPSTDKITSGDFDIFFSSDFNFNDWTLNSITPGPGLFFLFGDPTKGSTYIEHIEPASFSGVGPQVFATLNFTAPGFITNTVVDLRDGGNGWGIFGSPDPANVTYIDGNIGVAPEPLSAVLFVIGGMFLTGRRLLRKRER